MKEFRKDELTVKILDSREKMGLEAARDISDCIRTILETKEEISMIFAAAPSQNEVLAALAADETIPWNRIRAYHMDEYVGIPADCPAGFANFLHRGLFDRVPFGKVCTLDCTNDAEEEKKRYAGLLREAEIDICVLGIGENGHIAFNDPHVADFNDPELVKIVDLDETCRMQQVHDGCFPDLDSVPKYALTLTIPALTRAAYMFCVVPAKTKAEAVRKTVLGEIGAKVPATVLRGKKDAVLYLDPDSASLLNT